jgi:hypothetical protein
LARVGVVVGAFTLAPHTGDGAADFEINEAADGEHAHLRARAGDVEIAGFRIGNCEVVVAVEIGDVVGEGPAATREMRPPISWSG